MVPVRSRSIRPAINRRPPRNHELADFSGRWRLTTDLIVLPSQKALQKALRCHVVFPQPCCQSGGAGDGCWCLVVTRSIEGVWLEVCVLGMGLPVTVRFSEKGEDCR